MQKKKKQRGRKSPNFTLDKEISGQENEEPKVFKAGLTGSSEGGKGIHRRDFLRGLIGVGAGAAASLNSCAQISKRSDTCSIKYFFPQGRDFGSHYWYPNQFLYSRGRRLCI